MPWNQWSLRTLSSAIISSLANTPRLSSKPNPSSAMILLPKRWQPSVSRRQMQETSQLPLKHTVASHLSPTMDRRFRCWRCMFGKGMCQRPGPCGAHWSPQVRQRRTWSSRRSCMRWPYSRVVISTKLWCRPAICSPASALSPRTALTSPPSVNRSTSPSTSSAVF